MRILSVVLSFLFSTLILFSIGITQAGCSKTVTDHDTTIVKVHDTTIIKDTTIIRDTIGCNYDLTKGLIAYYNFNGGNLNDSSGFGNNITFNNASKTTDRFGNPNNAYLFSGDSTFMLVNNSASLNPTDSITMFAIIKVNGFWPGLGSCAGNQVFSKGANYLVNGFYGMQFYDYDANCGVPNISNEEFSGEYGDMQNGTGTGLKIDSVKVKTGQWYYLTYNYDGVNSKFYINGKLKGISPATVSFTANNSQLFIGKHENPVFPYYLNGVIDEIRIYHRVLCDGAVAQLSSIKN